MATCVFFHVPLYTVPKPPLPRIETVFQWLVAIDNSCSSMGGMFDIADADEASLKASKAYQSSVF